MDKRLAEMRLTEIEPKFVEYIPEVIEPGILYISKKYRTATHLCCCGCMHKVVTPLKLGFWELKEKNGKVSLSPSIGNFNLPCKSHYFISENRVLWC